MAFRRLTVEQAFGAHDRDSNLGSRSVRGGMTAVSSQAAQFAISMVGTVVLARLVSPTDYGLFGMVAAIVGFARVFRDGGLSFATVQRPVITNGQMNSLFWVNAGFVAGLGLIIGFSAPLLVRFYGPPQLFGITVVMAIAFVINCISTQHDAVLRRHMRFDTIAQGQIVAMIASVGVAILMALKGFGYWALVGSTVATAVVSTAYSFIMFPWVPGKFERGNGLKGMLRFGGDIMGFNFVNYFSRNSDNIIVGKFAGADALGLYGKAYNLFLLPLTQIRDPMIGVALPAMSALVGDPDRYSRYYARLVDGIATLSAPIALFCLIEADFLVRVMLGPQWMGVVPIFRVLAVVGIIQAAEATRGTVLMSRGDTRRHLKWGVVNGIVMVSSFLVGVRWGALGVAVAYLIASYVVLIPSLVYSFSGTPITLGLFARAVGPSLLCSFVAAVPAVGIRYAMGVDNIWGAVVGGVAFAAVYIGVSLVRPTFRDNAARITRELGRKAHIDKKLSSGGAS